MNRSIYFDHYRVAKEYDGSPVELAKVGPATVYKASDQRSGAPVALILLPQNAVNDADRERFEEQARASLLLDHVNVGRTLEFERTADDYVFVSEYPQGETLDKWIADNGPMSPDAVLRIGLQIVGALGAASFHNVRHRGIQPGNIMIVSGQTAEGGWPAVKLLHFPVAGLNGNAGGADSDAAAFASPEHLRDGTVDFRSEIYSLGATMCFLLTGVFYSGEPRSLQTRRFAGSLRKLLTPMLRQNPDERPQDPMLVGHEIRACLERVERRQMLANRFGIPFVPVKARVMRPRKKEKTPKSILAAALERPVRHEPPAPEPEAVVLAAPVSVPMVVMNHSRGLWWRRGLAIAAILVGAATVAAILLPAPVSMILHRHKDVTAIGEPVGVPQPAATPLGQKAVSVVSNQNVPRPGATPLGQSPSTLVSNQDASGPPAAEPSASVEPNSVNQPHQAVPMIASASTVSASESQPSPASSSTEQRIAATNNSSSSTPEPPAEGPQSIWEQTAGNNGRAHIARADTINQVAREENAPNSAAESSGNSTSDDSAAPSPHPSVSSKSATDTTTTKSNNTNTRPVMRHRPVAPNDESNYSARRYAGPAEPRPPQVERGSVVGRVVGITPDGNLILRLPNGHIGVVTPNQPYRAHRRVIIERRYVAPPFYPRAIPIPSDG